MKSAVLPLLLLTLLISGCAGKHYFKINDGEVSFYYKDTAAQEVLFASSQDNYKLHAAREIQNHLWEVSIPVAQEFTYFYVVNGVNTVPDCPYTEDDDFGNKNCVYISEM
jgi:hypothetical protein